MSERKKILVLCPSPFGTNPGQRLKYEQYFESWKEAGYDVTVSSFQTQRFWDIIYKPGHIPEKIFWTIFGYLRRLLDLFRIPFYDGLYIFMSVTPFGPPIFETLVATLNKKIIFDVEDMAFMPNASEANKWIVKLKGSTKYFYLMKKAKFVITSSVGLTEFVKKYNENAIDITATFNTDRFLPVKDFSNKEVTTIGWTGSHSTVPYLHILDNVFRQVAQKRKIKVLVISNSHYECEGVNVENIPWREATEVEDLHKIDIGVYPVPKEPWVLGKSGCKTITYMSIGIPSVSTCYGNVVRTVVTDKESGFLADSEQEWVDLLIDLIDNVSLRQRIGENARKRAEEFFSVKANRKIYLEVFAKVF